MSKIPNHIAIIMDGNGRWAQSKKLSRHSGHKAGVEAVRKVIEACAKRKVKNLTLFAFSSENWKRPKAEVNLLMELFLVSLRRELNKLHENNILIRFIGDRTAFAGSLLKQIIKAEELTKKNTGLVLAIAVNYGGRWDIAQATKKVVAGVLAGEYSQEEINPELISKYVCLAEFPEPDLFIRTSGEQRISNYLLWQLAYTELYFTDKHWPDYDEILLDEAIEEFNCRQRRFGKTQEQLNKPIENSLPDNVKGTSKN